MMRGAKRIRGSEQRTLKQEENILEVSKRAQVVDEDGEGASYIGL